MPKRTNWFQKLVFHIYEHVGEGVTVTESKLLVDAQSHSGYQREVDIVLEGKMGGQHVIVSFECKYSGGKRPRPADAPWVESMKAKHEKLPTDKLVLVSSSGFTPYAESMAQTYGIATMSLNVITAESVHAQLRQVERLWLRRWGASVGRMFVYLEAPNASSPVKLEVPSGLAIYDESARELFTTYDVAKAIMNHGVVVERLSANQDSDMRWFEFGMDTTHLRPTLFLRHTQTDRLDRITSIVLTGPFWMKTSFTIPWKFGKLGDLDVAWADSVPGIENLLLLATTESGDLRLTKHEFTLNSSVKK